MGNNLQDLFGGVGQNIINYLPNLFAGILLVAVGWLIGWFVKRHGIFVPKRIISM